MPLDEQGFTNATVDYRRSIIDPKLRRHLYRTICGLPREQERKIAKLYGLGYSATESAAVLGRPEGAIGPTITRIKRKLASLGELK